MKKITFWILIIVIVVAGIWFIKKILMTSPDPTISNYTNSNVSISFTYPKILSVKTTDGVVILHHEIAFEHHDYCDFKGEATTTIPVLTDFNVEFHIVEKNLIDTMKSESPYIPQENFVNGEVVESPGFIDSIAYGKLKGYKIFEGAEGCGQTTYYFPISSAKTLVGKEELITIFTGAIDKENEDKALAVPGVINKEKSVEIFDSILNTLKID